MQSKTLQTCLKLLAPADTLRRWWDNLVTVSVATVAPEAVGVTVASVAVVVAVRPGVGAVTAVVGGLGVSGPLVDLGHTVGGVGGGHVLVGGGGGLHDHGGGGVHHGGGHGSGKASGRGGGEAGVGVQEGVEAVEAVVGKGGVGVVGVEAEVGGVGEGGVGLSLGRPLVVRAVVAVVGPVAVAATVVRSVAVSAAVVRAVAVVACLGGNSQEKSGGDDLKCKESKINIEIMRFILCCHYRRRKTY